MMMSCAIPRKMHVNQKSISPVLPESPPKLKPKVAKITHDKLVADLAKYHKKTKFNSSNNSIELKKLKEAITGKKEKIVDYPLVKIHKSKLKMSKKLAKKEIKIDTYKKIN